MGNCVCNNKPIIVQERKQKKNDKRLHALYFLEIQIEKKTET